MTTWALGELFEKRAPHHGSIKILWEQKWRPVCAKSLYPFHDGLLQDFEPIFHSLIEKSVNDAYTDAYTLEFLPTARRLRDEALQNIGVDDAKAIELCKRSAAVYRISRFPSIWTPLKRQIFDEQKEVYMRGAALWKRPMREIFAPFPDLSDASAIPLYEQIPETATPEQPAPVVLLITGLDGHRPDNTTRSDEILSREWATVITDIPGVGDSPAPADDPTSADRMMTAILDYIRSKPELDEKRVIAWGMSMGGYYAVRAAHTHEDRLLGAIGHGAATHHALSRQWLNHVDDHEYPFLLTPALAKKFGFANVEDLKEHGQRKFSLKDNGILDRKSTRLLLVNGTKDGLAPIEDSILLFEYGRPKEARFFSGLLHMGYPLANQAVYPWMEEVMASARCSC